MIVGQTAHSIIFETTKGAKSVECYAGGSVSTIELTHYMFKSFELCEPNIASCI